MLAAANNHTAPGSAQCNGNIGRSDSPAPTSTMISRSGRSMKPPSPRSPLASARALMYEITCEVTRQIKVATTSGRLPRPNAAHQASPQNTAPSLIRAQVASSTAPNLVPPPLSRAIAPSTRSNITKNQITNVPANSWPMGNSVRAASTAAAVAMIVTLSAVKPACRNARATGLVTRATPSRDNSLLTSASSRLPVPFGGQQTAGVAKQLRDHLGIADDRDEVGVATPSRHHVHVQVLGQRTARRLPQIDSDVETVWARYVLDHPNRLLDERHQLAAFRLGQILELRKPAVWHHHQMPRVVRVEVEHGVDQFTAGHDQTVFVGQLRDVAERLGLAAVVLLERPLGQVTHSVGRPQPLQMVGFTHPPVDDRVVLSHECSP